ncbi:hypothetical protein ADIS_2015 [Lunatimonas lonarensis]|uniref:NIPSNAP domain-containing protein n=1 Tax=Lunatimonas lonarensis TaxID=1232681 RepID=R7ZTN5_9BACT|nr:hypothetical protein [Lunatimonas lonarensis]EON77485.1 hypothetical protein ADIS_2015 [Lunatimonas lonarensis]
MKKFISIGLLAFLICHSLVAQERRYLVFEFIRVDAGKTVDYLEYKDFLAKVYGQAVKKGDIQGWDLWSMKTGSDPDAYQFATITYYSDPVKMMDGTEPEILIKYAQQAFPQMQESQLLQRLKAAADDRDLAIRSYMVEIARTNDQYHFKPGTLASFDLMKAVEGNFEEYEMAEREVFLPIHQRKISANLMEHWCLLRTALPTGSQANSTHMTMNVYKDYLQFFNSMEYEDIEMSDRIRQKVEKGLKSRDQKWVYLATLETMVR